MKKLSVVMAMLFTVASACSGGGSSGSQAAFCSELAKDKATFESSLPDTPDRVAQYLKAFDDLTNAAPSEIKAEMQTLKSFVHDSTSAASELSKDPSDSRSSSRDSQLSQLEPSLQAASSKVTAFATDKCHIDLGASASSTFSSVASSIN